MKDTDGVERDTARTGPLHLLSLITSYRITQILHVAARLGLADLLADGPKRSEDLAAATASHGPSVYRLLRALASIGVFCELEHDLFTLTPLGEYLRSDVPGSMRSWAIMVGGEHHWRPWEQLLYAVQTGKPAFDHVLGTGPFSYYTENPEAGQVFQAALSGLTQIVNPAIAAAYDFSPLARLVDVGGGLGLLITSILEAHPHLEGTLFDLPEVIQRAAPRITAQGLGDRCAAMAGDFFAAVPAGGDAYLLKHILHDWDDDRAVAILRNCRRAMADGGRVLVIEMVIPPGNSPSYGKLLDIEMLVGYTGRERTAEAYGALFAQAGLQLSRIIPTDALVSVVEGVAGGRVEASCRSSGS